LCRKFRTFFFARLEDHLDIFIASGPHVFQTAVQLFVRKMAPSHRATNRARRVTVRAIPDSPHVQRIAAAIRAQRSTPWTQLPSYCSQFPRGDRGMSFEEFTVICKLRELVGLNVVQRVGKCHLLETVVMTELSPSVAMWTSCGTAGRRKSAVSRSAKR